MHTTVTTTRSPVRQPGNESLASRLRAAADLLEEIVADRTILAQIPEADRNRFLNAAGRVSRPDALDRRRLLKVMKRKRRDEKIEKQEVLLASTGIRKLRRERVLITSPNVYAPTEEDLLARAQPIADTEESRVCYVCKDRYSTVHHFYDRLCASCADENFAKRTELADLRGRVALLTGGRVKIGYQAGLKLLRSGARLIVTTRFPRDSAARYARRMMRTDRFGHLARIPVAPRWRTAGEALEWHTGWRLRPRRTVDEWMASPEHRAILLSRRFTRIGAGHACGRYRRLRATMWVAHVARP